MVAIAEGVRVEKDPYYRERPGYYVDGPLLPLVMEISDPVMLRAILAQDIVERGRVIVKEGEVLDPQKPFVDYAGMNGGKDGDKNEKERPDRAILLGALKIALAEFGLERQRIVLTCLASSGSPIASVVELLPHPELVTVVPTTKNPKTVERWRAEGFEVVTFPVSPYANGRSNGDYKTRVPVSLRGPKDLVGNEEGVVVAGDDMIAEGESLEAFLRGLSQYVRPENIRLFAVASKRMQRGDVRLRGLVGSNNVVEAIPIESVSGAGDRDRIIIGLRIRKEFEEEVS